MADGVNIEHFDVLIIGAGLSGIGAGAQVRMELPGKTFAILEGREASGGTWDLFRYPGVRSDSDMYTLGYRFRPWKEQKAIADGPSILKYIRETAREYDLEKAIRYGHHVRRAEWDSDTAKWTVEVSVSSPHVSKGSRKNENLPQSREDVEEKPSQVATFTCNFLYLCTGYYKYEEGYTPEWPGFDEYKGTLVHPQFWPDNLDYAGKRVLVIGSGATAVTLVPAMAETAAHVTMLQRSPTYIVSMPAEDKIANGLRAVLPAKAAYAATRWKNVLRQMLFYQISKKRPSFMKRLIAKGVEKELGHEAAETHFKPTYNPWDQRLCLVPDSDLFASIREGRASVVTATIETFTEKGVRLASGEEIEADIIVTATGLVLKIMAGLTLVVDGETVDLSKKIAYKGMMYNDVPNLAQAFGYTNASWTLKCDLTSEYVCRLIKHMDEHGFRSCTPRLNDESITREPALDFNSGYVLRALGEIPSQGSKMPWRLHQNYVKDLSMLRYGRLEDGTMEFRGK
ncbi:MAG TPA: NAD(P)/FAD-dependent oxidoreductase [Pyrinomonadaceae bacterium]|nr:FAD-containing monooxygenase EthA [Blastocatellia bacterium]HRJ88847.1 NAD(P)/FAD-dependent oxidoreductase [Pyrinomonadaceae bacterium]HRK48880.1 NAD(P)/FAD-dependent oxidoreductase [Pyrinomonadaceae bacterium]